MDRPYRFASEQPAEEETENSILRSEDFIAGNLRRAFPSILKDYGHFANSPAAALAHKEHLHQERISAGEDLIEGD